MSTIVGTNIEVTNIKYDSDTTSMIISNTGQITAQGEGTATTNVQQGLAKTWTQFNGTGTVAITDSFNYASIVDEGTGVYRINFTSNMANSTFSIQSHDWSYGNGWSDTQTTGGHDTKRRNEAGAYLDVGRIWCTVLGDLG